MERASDEEVSKSDESLGENSDHQVVLDMIESDKELLEKKKMEEQVERMQEVLNERETEMILMQQMLTNFDDSFSNSKISQLQASTLPCPVSSIDSLIPKSGNLSEDVFEELPNPTLLEGSLSQPDNVSYDPIEASAKQTKGVANNLGSIQEMIVTHITKFIQSSSPPKTPDNKTQAAGSNSESETKLKTSPNLEMIETNKESNRNSGGKGKGKGKEAANPKDRYFKRSRTNVSSCESSAKHSPVKHSKDSSSTESKTLGFLLPRAELTRIYPSLKRKGSDLCEKDQDKLQLEENRARVYELPGNLSDDHDLEIAKKLKFEDDEKSRKDQILNSLLSKDERFDLPQLMDQSQKDQKNDKSEQLVLPSSSSLSTVDRRISSSEESHLAIGTVDVGDVSPIKRIDSFISSVREDMSPSGKTCVPCKESLYKDSPVSEETFGTQQSQALDSLSPQDTRISPTVKRKGSDSNEIDVDLQIAEKSKREDDGKAKRRTILDGILDKKVECDDIQDFINPPSTSGLSNTGRLISTSVESSLSSESVDLDILISRQFATQKEILYQQQIYESYQLEKFRNQPISSGQSNIGRSISTNDESSLASGIEDVLISERGESSLTSVTEISSSERGDTSADEDTSRSGSGES